MSRINGKVSFMGGLREDDARIRLEGLREDDANIRLDGLREEDAGIVLEGLREDDARISLQGLREDDARIRLEGVEVGEVYYSMGVKRVRPINNAVIFRRLRRDQQPASEMDPYGQARRFHPADFSEDYVRSRRAESRGTEGRKAAVAGTHQMADVFSIFRSLPSFEEFKGRIETLMARWTPLKARIDKLPSQQRVAVLDQLAAMGASPDVFAQVATYPGQGPSGVKNERVSRVKRLEAALPSIEQLVSQMETTGPAATPQQEAKKAAEVVITDVKKREQEVAGGFVEKAAPYVGAGVGVIIVGLVVKTLAGW